MLGDVSVGQRFYEGSDDGYAFELDLPPRIAATLSAGRSCTTRASAYSFASTSSRPFMPNAACGSHWK